MKSPCCQCDFSESRTSGRSFGLALFGALGKNPPSGVLAQKTFGHARTVYNSWMPVMITKDYIQSIVERENLVVRNLQVTQGYYRLSQGMRRCTSGKNVSWCSFATHASKTAGQALRHELMPRLLRSAMIRLAGYEDTFVFFSKGLGDPDQLLAGVGDSRLGEVLRRVSLLISQGNSIVFEELAWPFASFIRSFSKDWDYDLGKLQAFLDEHFQPGPLHEGGQNYLIEAFTAYYKARYETRANAKADHVLQGNLLVGLHEQTRLQPQIEQALSMPVELLSEPARDSGAKRIALNKRPTMMRKIVSRAITRMLMSITLPSRELKLSQNVVAPTGITSFPKDLLQIENSRCLQLVRHFETRQDTLSGSGAENWAGLRDRMSFVVDFFRSHQQYERLWESPFLDEQVPVIEAGHFPAGPL